MDISHLLKDIVKLIGGVPLANDALTLIKIIKKDLKALILLLLEVTFKLLNLVWCLLNFDE